MPARVLSDQPSRQYPTIEEENSMPYNAHKGYTAYYLAKILGQAFWTYQRQFLVEYLSNVILYHEEMFP